MSGHAELEAMIRKIRLIPELSRKTAPAAAESFDRELRAELAAGRSPDGEAWAPKKDGGRALANAGSNAITTAAIGTRILTKTRAHYWAHNRGTSKVPQRKIIPTELTPKLADAIRRPLVEAFDRTVRRG